MKRRLQIDKKTTHSILGLTFRFMRLKAGYSLRDLGDLVNMSHTLIANIETNKVVPSSDTLRDLLRVFDITYRDDEELIAEFSILYERAFRGLYMMQYNAIKEDMVFLDNHESTYIHSIVTLEYTTLRLLYAALMDGITKQQREDIDLLSRVSSMMSDDQRQMLFLIIGIDLYNRGRYYEAHKTLQEATKIGLVGLDPFIHLFIIRSLVKMYRFMDAQKLAVTTIRAFEEDLNYARAMEVRLELAISNIHIHKFDEAQEYIEKIYLYGSQYNNQYFIEHSFSQQAMIALRQGDILQAQQHVDHIKSISAVTIFIQMVIAHAFGNTATVRTLYDRFINEYNPLHRPRDLAFMRVIAMEYGAIDCSDKEYIEALEYLIDISIKGHDQELLHHGYKSMIEYYKKKRMYKKALELSETLREIRSYGVL